MRNDISLILPLASLLIGATAATARAGTVGAKTPRHPCAMRLGIKPWEGGVNGLNPCTGNLAVTVGAGPIALVYNAMDAASRGPAGFGMRLAFRQRLTQNPDGSVTRVLGDGEPIVYAKGPGGFASPPETDTTLVQTDAATFVVAARGGTRTILTQPNGVAWAITSVVDRNGNTMAISYDAADHETAIQDPVGRAVQLTWHGDLLASVTDPEGLTWTLGYDDAQNLTTVTAPSGAAEVLTYDSAGQHLLVRLTTATGVVLGDYSYNADGSLAATTTASGETTVFSSFALQVAATDAYQRTTRLNYTDHGEVLAVIDSVAVQRTAITYDALHRMITQVDAMGQVERYAYNDNHDLIRYTNRYGDTTTWAYDERHNPTQITDPAGLTTTITYDAHDLPLTIRDSAGRQTTFNRDVATGNLLAVLGSDGTTLASYSYGPRGELLTATGPQGPKQTTTYGYDQYLHVSSVTAANGLRWQAASSPIGRPLTATDPASEQQQWSYDGANRLIGGRLPDGVSVSQQLDSDNRATTLTLGAGTNVSASEQRTFTYNANGSLATQQINGVTDPAQTGQGAPPPIPAAPLCLDDGRPLTCQDTDPVTP